MSARPLETFDRTLQASVLWLDEIVADIGPDRERAWSVLSTVLRVLRERIPTGLAGAVGAALPTLVRGAYYDQYRPAAQLICERSADEFLNHVAADLSRYRDLKARDATRTVFAVLARHIAQDQSEEVREALPEGLRDLWRASRPTERVRPREPDFPLSRRAPAARAPEPAPAPAPAAKPEPAPKPAPAPAKTNIMPELPSLRPKAAETPPPATPKLPPLSAKPDGDTQKITLDAPRRFRTAASTDY